MPVARAAGSTKRASWSRRCRDATRCARPARHCRAGLCWPAQARRPSASPSAGWIDDNVPGGRKSDFGQLCVSTLLDEYGGPADEQSALNLIYLLGYYDSSASGLQPRGAPQLSGSDEKWHISGGNDQLISGLIKRLPAGTVRLGERLVALLQFSRRVWNTDGWTGTYYSDQLSQSGWETTIDQPGAPGILVALPGGATGADIGSRYGLRSCYGPHRRP
jgi:hypothetical protein